MKFSAYDDFFIMKLVALNTADCLNKFEEIRMDV